MKTFARSDISTVFNVTRYCLTSHHCEQYWWAGSQKGYVVAGGTSGQAVHIKVHPQPFRGKLSSQLEHQVYENKGFVFVLAVLPSEFMVSLLRWATRQWQHLWQWCGDILPQTQLYRVSDQQQLIANSQQNAPWLWAGRTYRRQNLACGQFPTLCKPKS